jgi:hypothetical protein
MARQRLGRIRGKGRKKKTVLARSQVLEIWKRTTTRRRKEQNPQLNAE